MAAVPPPPADEYRGRLAHLQATLASLSSLDTRVSRGRLVVFAIGAALALAGWQGVLSQWWTALPVSAFAVLMHVHDRVIRAKSVAARSIAFYERGLARIEDRWSGSGEPGERFRDESHPYANDLDLFGRGSLFELLSIARTKAGEEMLARWLTRPASPDEIRARQEAVNELTPALDLREALALAGADVGAAVHGEALVGWAEGTVPLVRPWLIAIAAALTALAIATGAYGVISGNYAPVVAVLLAEALFSIPQRGRIQQALHAAEGPARDLDVLAHVLDRLEQEHFNAPRLRALRHRLETAGEVRPKPDTTYGRSVPASVAIRRLHRLVELHDWQHNQFFAPFAAALLWGTHLAGAIERWRLRYGSQVEAWLLTVGEFEALSSMSAYRYEHPDDVWPEIVEGPARFEAGGVGHPLIAATRIVRNDVHLSDGTRLLVVSGSNMSGKSTLLRTVGINGVLALAGAPVRAASLRLTPLAIGATLRIQDSLQEGRSRFYAEITRIRELADAADGPLPLLFLFDELFQGTNSHDRLIGASGVLRSLVARGAIGLITTHDLALTAIADALAPRAANVHFEDDFDAGEIRFDYRLKPGPVVRSNAVALMRAIGLDVGHGGSDD